MSKKKVRTEQLSPTVDQEEAAEELGTVERCSHCGEWIPVEYLDGGACEECWEGVL